MRFYFLRNTKKNKKQFQKFGSHIGFCLSFVVILLGLIYLIDLIINTRHGNYDVFQDNRLQHDYKYGYGTILLTPDDIEDPGNPIDNTLSGLAP